ncbi:uncharacterized protein LOC121504690 isoform X2 [Cheilinus undulatus]|uniref:uncharacterized protein LOC121504690 isoform X2 n=1 Tax=Cheilinus undulatus TaxID=241271 RepID=UPI001BD26167|nr:uncharacterized protein LOC121504690 isoform X2 [Cheilinus undulatus]
MTPVCFLILLFLRGMAQLTSQKSSFSLHQERRFVAARVGDTVTLQCFYDGDDAAWLYWYKQSLGQKPRLISTLYIYDTRITFKDEFDDSSRFRLSTANKTNHLTILNIQFSDSATYYCVRTTSFVLTFSEGTVLSVKGSGLSVQASVYQSESGSIQNGGSVTLNCMVHTGSCGEEHSVYWFRNSEEAQQEIIYTHGGRNDQCVRTHNRETNTCNHNLLDPSHAGTYYCAVASCGLILFGNGTNLDFKDDGVSLLLVYLLSGALAFTIMLVVPLAFTACAKEQCSGSHARASRASTAAGGSPDADDLQYENLWKNKANRSLRQRDGTWSECVYYTVRQ